MIVGGGLCLLCYPWISNWLYSHSVDSEVEVYREQTEDRDHVELQEMLADAKKYNEQLKESRVALTDPFVFDEDPDTDLEYESVLSLDESGLMCFVGIPKINVNLPVYHGTSKEVLQKGVGHLEGSSLPVGGEGAHAVLSAHTGINSSKMFSDLPEMEEGDLFFIHVLDETLAYRVCSIQVILPEDTSSLVPEEGRDLVTLITCTPYGVNSHRLVVTGERTEYTDGLKEEAERETSGSGSQWMRVYRKALLIGLCVVAAVAVMIKLYKKTAARKLKKEQRDPV